MGVNPTLKYGLVLARSAMQAAGGVAAGPLDGLP